MPPRRTANVEETITLHVDGRPIPARPGEPVAVALLAAGRLVLGRSVKYHRPRGAVCYEGRCDGCLMRVDGRPNVMTCRTPARDGMVVETQNVVGSAEQDLLAATDWFFPHGMDHHQMFTWSKPLNRVMQTVARRIAGIGELPSEPAALVPAEDIHADVIVVGGGPAGLAAAAAAARAPSRPSVLLVEEEDALGGHLRFGPPPEDAEAQIAALVAEARDAGVRVALGSSVVAVYQDLVAIEGAERLSLARPRALVVATGEHEGSLPIPGNDIPGVIHLRAALRLLAHGVLPGEHVAIVGSGPRVARLAHRLEKLGVEVFGPYAPAGVQSIHGRPRVKSIRVETAGRVDCDAVVVAAPPSSVYEIAAQAGAGVIFRDDRFDVVASPEDGTTNHAFVRAVGHCTGVSSLEAILDQARAAGAAAAATAAVPRARAEAAP